MNPEPLPSDKIAVALFSSVIAAGWSLCGVAIVLLLADELQGIRLWPMGFIVGLQACLLMEITHINTHELSTGHLSMQLRRIGSGVKISCIIGLIWGTLNVLLYVLLIEIYDPIGWILRRLGISGVVALAIYLLVLTGSFCLPPSIAFLLRRAVCVCK